MAETILAASTEAAFTTGLHVLLVNAKSFADFVTESIVIVHTFSGLAIDRGKRE